MEHRIQKNRHHPGGGGAFEFRLRGIVLRPVFAERAIRRPAIRRLLLQLVKRVGIGARLLPIRRIASQFPAMEHAQQSVALMTRRPETAVVNGVPAIQDQLRHDFPGLARALVAGQKVVDMLRARIDVLQIGAALWE